MKLLKVPFALLALYALPVSAQQVINGSRSLLGNWDASGAATTKPAKVGTVVPATCGVGEVFFKSDALPGSNLYFCGAVNTWTQMQVSGAGSLNYRQTFNSVTSVVLAHNLNSSSVVFACYDNSTIPLWILPKSVAVTNANNLTVTFAAPQSGSCVVNSNGSNVTYSGGTGITITGPSIAVDRATIPIYLANSASLTFGSIAQAACAQLTFALTGALVGDSIAPGWPSTLAAGLVGDMFVSASNTITVRLCNLSGATLTPVVQTFKATIIK